MRELPEARGTMRSDARHQPAHGTRAAWSLLAALASLGASCARQPLSADAPDAAAYLELVMPREIEIQRYLTKPARLDGAERANGIEVILAARDELGDLVKSAGVFIFELHQVRPASGDRAGMRLAMWRVEIRTPDDMRRYWDRLTRFHDFPLQLEHGTLAPGRYILRAQLETPGGPRLFDEYRFTHEGD